MTVCSPVVLPAAVVAELDALPATDFAELVEALRGAVPGGAGGGAHRGAPGRHRTTTSAVLAALTEPIR